MDWVAPAKAGPKTKGRGDSPTPRALLGLRPITNARHFAPFGCIYAVVIRPRATPGPRANGIAATGPASPGFALGPGVAGCCQCQRTITAMPLQGAGQARLPGRRSKLASATPGPRANAGRMAGRRAQGVAWQLGPEPKVGGCSAFGGSLGRLQLREPPYAAAAVICSRAQGSASWRSMPSTRASSPP